MFKLNLSETYKYPVEFSVITDTGKPQTFKLGATFKRLSREEIVELQRGNTAEFDRTGSEVIEADIDYLLEFLDDLEGFGDSAGNALPFNRENLAKLLNAVPAMHAAISAAFFASAAGGRKQKNS